jgi:hypothetical protein
MNQNFIQNYYPLKNSHFEQNLTDYYYFDHCKTYFLNSYYYYFNLNHSGFLEQIINYSIIILDSILDLKLVLNL